MPGFLLALPLIVVLSQNATSYLDAWLDRTAHEQWHNPQLDKLKGIGSRIEGLGYRALGYFLGMDLFVFSRKNMSSLIELALGAPVSSTFCKIELKLRLN